MKLTPSKHRFLTTVKAFMAQHHLIPSSKKLYVATSTGVDSMVLLDVMLQLKSELGLETVSCLHVNHKTRPECDQEETFLKSFCESRGIDFLCKRLEKRPVNQNNFEAWARAKRYEFFYSLLGQGDFLATAHHLDDSFEWWLMNSLKTSSLDVLGIPVKNAGIVRPFLTVSKKQILTYARQNQITYFEDSSNHNTDYERNFIRHEVLSKLNLKYPQMLKHYVARSNEMLKILKRQKRDDIVVQKSVVGESCYLRFNQVPSVKLIKQKIAELSNSNRGKIHGEVIKLTQSIANFRTGPMDFSGGVKVYFNLYELFFINRKGLETYQKQDDALLALALNDELTFSPCDIQAALTNNDFFPGIFLVQDEVLKQKLKPTRKAHSLLPRFTQYLIEQGAYFVTQKDLLYLVRKDSKLISKEIFLPRLLF